MALFRKLFYRKPPDGLLEICERVYGAFGLLVFVQICVFSLGLLKSQCFLVEFSSLTFLKCGKIGHS